MLVSLNTPIATPAGVTILELFYVEKRHKRRTLRKGSRVCGV